MSHFFRHLVVHSSKGYNRDLGWWNKHPPPGMVKKNPMNNGIIIILVWRRILSINHLQMFTSFCNPVDVCWPKLFIVFTKNVLNNFLQIHKNLGFTKHALANEFLRTQKMFHKDDCCRKCVAFQQFATEVRGKRGATRTNAVRTLWAIFQMRRKVTKKPREKHQSKVWDV